MSSNVRGSLLHRKDARLKRDELAILVAKGSPPLYPPLGNRRLAEVTAFDVQQIVFRKRDNGFEAAAAQIRNLFKRLFDYAITCDRFVESCTRDPTRFITRARSRTRAPSPDEPKKISANTS